MQNKISLKLVIVLFAVSYSEENSFAQPAPKKETTELEDIANDFKEAKFLQVDSLKIPKELARIEEQIKQNAIDVVINSRTHTPVFAQKLPKGYTESYTKFHGLQVEIVPIPKEEDFYSLNFFYYNWTNRKVDKRLKVRISKYNVLNEMRFGLYELLLGKQYVIDNKDMLEKQNFDRIQAVRKTVEEKEKEERDKKKEKKKLDEKLEQKKIEKEERDRNRIKRPELEKKEKNQTKADQASEDSEAEKGVAGNGLADQNEKSDIENDSKSSSNLNLEKDKDKNNIGKKKVDTKKLSNAGSFQSEKSSAIGVPEIPNPSPEIPIKSSLYAFGSFFEDVTDSRGILISKTNLRYIGFGARYIQDQITDKPQGMRFTIKSGIAIKKDDYTFPIYRAFETEMSRGNIFGFFKMFLGLDYSPIYFVNLPEAGEGLKVFENDIFWLKLGISYAPELFGKEVDFRIAYLKSLLVNSNQKKEFSGNSLSYSIYYQHTDKQGFELSYQQTYLVGDLEVDSKSVGLAYIYKFEN